MYTRCPKCSTCFRVTDRHLAIAKGKVRCGQCQLVFNAPEHAIDDLPVNTISTPHIVKTKIKKPIFDADIAAMKKDNVNENNNVFNDNFDLDAAIDKLTQETGDINKDDIIIEEKNATKKPEQSIPAENNSSDTFTANVYDARNKSDFIELDNELADNKSESKNITEKTLDENEVPFQLRNDIELLQAPSQRRWHPLFGFSFFIILLILSFSQLAYFRASELANRIPSTRPLLEAFCETVNCRYSGLRDIKQIQLLSRDVHLHPKEKKALLISATIINNAHFAQPYPDIHIRLSDISGNVVAERIFNAKIYMGKLSHSFLLMKSKTPVHINFEVVDPGIYPVNFEFTIL